MSKRDIIAYKDHMLCKFRHTKTIGSHGETVEKNWIPPKNKLFKKRRINFFQNVINLKMKKDGIMSAWWWLLL